MAAALNSQVEGKDPHQAVGAAMVKGLLQESLLKSLPYLKILLRCGGRRSRTALLRGRVAWELGSETRPASACRHPERPGPTPSGKAMSSWCEMATRSLW
jgi:hypothetical protein